MADQEIDLKVWVGRRIRQLRRERGWSQSELAFRADMQDSYLAALERADRNVTLDSLSRVVKALEVSPAEAFRFGDLELGEETEGKWAAIQLLVAFLSERSLGEVELIRKISKDVMTTIDTEKKKLK